MVVCNHEINILVLIRDIGSNNLGARRTSFSNGTSGIDGASIRSEAQEHLINQHETPYSEITHSPRDKKFQPDRARGAAGDYSAVMGGDDSRPAIMRSKGTVPERMWNSWWLNRGVLVAFSTAFFSMFAALIVLYRVSTVRDGLSTLVSTSPYSWTYGPTARKSSQNLNLNYAS